MNTKEKLNRVEKALYIKLGKRGEFVEECIKNNILKIGFNNIDHDLCLQNEWEKVRDGFIKDGHSNRVATNFNNQVKKFYQADENVLWFTFHNQRLYWCFSENKVSTQEDNSKIRNVIGEWSCKDLEEGILLKNNLGGHLTRTQGYMGTICSVAEEAKNYLIKKIKVEQSNEIKEVEESLGTLKDKLILLIETLNEGDLEILVDLIFRGGGWQRVGAVGGVQNDIDLFLFHPITGETAVVQTKCGTNLNEFIEYKNIFAEMPDYDRFFYVMSKPQGSSEQYLERNDMDNLNLYFSDKIAELAINAGLIDWILKKVE